MTQIRVDFSGRPTCEYLNEDWRRSVDWTVSYLEELQQTCAPYNYLAAYNGGCRNQHYDRPQRYQRWIRTRIARAERAISGDFGLAEVR